MVVFVGKRIPGEGCGNPTQEEEFDDPISSTLLCRFGGSKVPSEKVQLDL